MTDKSIDFKKLEELAREVRISIIDMLITAKSGHTGGPLGMADVFTALYFGGLVKYDPKNPTWPERDYVVLSNGHICPVLYVTLAKAGFFPEEELKTFRQINSRLQGHSHRLDTPGVEFSTGSLGQGISAAVGMAMALKSDKRPNRVICLDSDGEMEEGSSWEAFLCAARYKLDNLTFIIDRNHMQIDGRTDNISSLEPLDKKYEAFNLEVFSCDGNNIEDFYNTFKKAVQVKSKPSVIIAHTVMGKGVSFMENDYTWHGKPPTPEQGKMALAELEG